MKNIKSFKRFSLNENSTNPVKLPNSSGSRNPENDEYIFWFSTKDEKYSLVINCFFEIISNIDKLKGKEINSQNFYCTYKKGDKNIVYSYLFWTPNEEVVKRSEGHYKGQEWQLDAEIPSDIIEKLNNSELSTQNTEAAKKRINSESSWSLYDGMDPEGLRTGEKDGWQLSYIMDTEDNNRWIEQQKKSRSNQPEWIRNFATWITDKFG